MQYKKLIYLESAADVDTYIKSGRVRADENLFITVNPSVRAYSKKKGIASETTLPYLTNESHFKLSLKSKELSDWIDKNVNFADMEFKITRGYHNDISSRWMRFFINYYLLLIEIALNSCDLHKPKILMSSWHGRKCPSRQYINAAKRLLIQPEEKYMGSIVTSIAKTKGLGFEDISIGKSPLIRERYFLKLVKNIFFLILFMLLYLRHKLKTSVISNKMKLKKKPIIIFTTSVSYMKKLARKLKKDTDANFYFLQRWVIPDFGALGFAKLFLRKYLNSLTLQRKLSREFSEKIRKEKDFFSYRGISFADILAEKFENDIAPYIIGLHIWTIELTKIIRRFKPSLIISSGNRLDDSITGELCREMKIPAVMASHGSFVRPKDEIERIEWGENGKPLLRAPFPFIALQSPLAEDYIKVFSPGGDIVKTGPLVWGRPINIDKSRLLFKKMFNKTKDSANLRVIVHAATQKPNNSLKFHIYETPDEYIQSLLDLARAIQRIPEALLIIKFKPRCEFNTKDLKSLIPFSDKIILSVKEQFLDLLGISDLLVSFSSTTIIEAFQNKIPVLLYGGGGRYQHIPAYEIKTDRPIERSAVYYIKNPDDLKYGISGILDLRLDRNKDSNLFESYIYKEDERVPLFDLMNRGKKVPK